MTGKEEKKGYGFGWFQGVFTPSILTIIGVVMYLRFGWMLGNVGLATSLLIVTMGSAITFLTGLSISTLATNMRMKGGGAYFMLSRSLGLEMGAALGIPLALSQAIGVSFYVAGFAEALVNARLPVVSSWDPRIVGLVTLTVLAFVSTLSANIALRMQYFIMAAIGLSLASFFLGSTPAGLADLKPAAAPSPIGFWPVFAVFFPAVTGILSGVGMSGDLREPGKAIPIGTLTAVLVGYLIYMSVPIALHHFVPEGAILRTDTMILQKCARWPWLILAGVWAATLSSAIGSFLCAPRVLQALSRDRLLPSFIGRGYGRADDPRVASVACFALAAAGIWLGDINVLAPILTLFNLSTYGLLNLSAAFEEILGNPSWRPTFRVKAIFSLLGFVGCMGAMFMISPGWTFIALFCEIVLYWFVKRRALRTQWGDMRTGLWMAGIRYLMRKLTNLAGRERNWRPNLLVMCDLPLRNLRPLELAREISDGRSLVTLASVVREASLRQDNGAGLRDSLLRTAEKLSLACSVKIISAADDWAGMAELVRSYGFGPIVPNTILLGLPQPERAREMASFMRTIARHRRNVILAGGTDAVVNPSGFIDIWWRGLNGNAGLMLALAFLMQRRDLWRKHPLRVNIIVQKLSNEEAGALLDELLKDARIRAQTRIIQSAGEPFAETVVANSVDAALTFIGLRDVQPADTDTTYGDYFEKLVNDLANVPYPVFVRASEDVDFRRIFT
ncbi:MAG: amino acid permease [Kiritimatiellia bacterium]